MLSGRDYWAKGPGLRAKVRKANLPKLVEIVVTNDAWLRVGVLLSVGPFVSPVGPSGDLQPFVGDCFFLRLLSRTVSVTLLVVLVLLLVILLAVRVGLLGLIKTSLLGV